MDVKQFLHDETDIEPEHQKLLGFSKSACDSSTLAEFPPAKAAGYSLILMGSTRAELDSVKETEEMRKLR